MSVKSFFKDRIKLFFDERGLHAFVSQCSYCSLILGIDYFYAEKPILRPFKYFCDFSLRNE